MSKDSGKDPLDYMVEAYDNILDHVHDAVKKTEGDVVPTVKELYANAAQKISDLGELTREETTKIGDYVKRDVDSVAHWLNDTEEDVSTWLRYDAELLENRALDMLKGVADKTLLDMQQFNEELHQHAEFRTGQISGVGTLVCLSCGKALHFYKTGHIPPCPKCHATVFERQVEDN